MVKRGKGKGGHRGDVFKGFEVLFLLRSSFKRSFAGQEGLRSSDKITGSVEFDPRLTEWIDAVAR